MFVPKFNNLLVPITVITGQDWTVTLFLNVNVEKADNVEQVWLRRGYDLQTPTSIHGSWQ